jgi:hypothetical protein
MRIPKKPFPNYKWRWAVYTPTESLNDPPIFLGILRVLRANEFKKFSSEEVNNGLEVVQEETQSTVNLVRSQERNIFRNSGQYWRGLGMLENGKRGQIILSPFGRKLADGELTKVEFATTIIKTLELPNRRIENDTSDWDNIGLSFKPFEIILEILSSLEGKLGSMEAFITPEELIRIVIPLAGANGVIDEYIEALYLFRNDELDLDEWPDCAPEANDKRMAREFLLYLTNYGFCKTISLGTNQKDKYFLANISLTEIDELFAIDTQETELDRIERIIRSSQIPANIERKKVVREVLERPYQNQFRKMIMEAYESTCIVTGVKLENVLEAAHIKPVKYKGDDSVYNGICMRADIHTLFDSNHLKIYPSGEIKLTDEAKRKENYGTLPAKILLPDFIDRQQLDWRMKYY